MPEPRLPFITLCDLGAPLRLHAAGFKATFPRRLSVWSMWHPTGLGDVDFALTAEPGLVQERIVSDALSRVIALIEGRERIEQLSR